MATTPEPTKGVPRIEGNPDPKFRADFNSLADFVLANLDSSVASFSALPPKGNWSGRHRFVVDERTWYVWVSTQIGWIPDTDETVSAFTFAGIYGNANAAYETVKVVTQGGRITLEGVASNTSTANFVAGENYTLGTVAPALAPAKRHRFACPWSDIGLAIVDVYPTGSVQFKLNVSSPNTPAGVFNMGLSGISWRLKRAR